MPPNWVYSIHTYDCLKLGEVITSTRVIIQLAPDYDEGNNHTKSFEYNTCCTDTDVFAFDHKLQYTDSLEHSTDAIKLDGNIPDLDKNVHHHLITPRVIGILSEDAPNKS